MKLFRDFVTFGALINIATCEVINVSIPDGKLQGSVMKDYDNEEFYSFTKIPFARPPIGEYRFKQAECNRPWRSILDATQPSPVCIQPNANNTAMIGQEDCLYLNVYTKTTYKYAFKPVLVYIYGGKFIQGSSAEYGPEFIMTGDIVFVTINYRLGVYGFMNTINAEIASESQMFGNNGFKDQVMAFKWIRRNIKSFGGDPERVTISGESAGAMAVHAHILSPLSKGLFHQAISMSGSTLVPEMQTANDTATPLAKYLGLNTTNYNAMMQGLRNATNEELFKAAQALKWFEIRLNSPCPTALVIEKPGRNSFISDYPLNILRSGKYNHVSYMIGNNNREGLFLYANRALQPNLAQLDTRVPFYFHHRNEVMEQIRQFYNLSSMDGPLNSVDYDTDIWFRYHTFRTAREHAKVQRNGQIYCYQFSGVGTFNYMKYQFPSIRNLYGACHADELGYLYQTVGIPKLGSLEETLMRVMVKTWTHFVIHGKPHENLEHFQVNAHHYVNITNNGFKFSQFNEKSFLFWDDIYRNYTDGSY